MTQTKRNPSVVIIGAGMTGILMTIKLRQAGITDIVVLEKKESVGGTWRENTYPGAACDVPAHMYTYSFEPNPNWSRFFARGPEIKQYFEHVVDKYDVARDIRFNEAVTDAQYTDGKWTIKTSKGQTYIADFMVCATGILHHPQFPNIAGLDDFKGAKFHTAQWDHGVEISANTRVGIIGTGSTAAQAIPELINTGATVSVFQRTPQWLMHLPDFTFSHTMRKLMTRYPIITKIHRNTGKFFLEHFFTKAVTGQFIQKHLLSFLCKANLRLSIKDKVLREKLRPNYQVGCKRVIINSTFYKGIQKTNAHLITEGIERITETGIITKDGKHHELDVLVLSTGFNAFNFMRPMNLIGRNNVHIDKAWAHKIKAYRSMLLSDYPNFFLMLGPNTPIGNFSVIAMSEVQTDYVIKLIDKWRAREFDEFEAKPQAIDDFTAYVKEGLKGTSWVGGCQSWYLDADGDPILWPYTWQRWVDEMKEPQMEHINTITF
ncbi:flavin-containing monooxygenase [Shewanella saliphila]|uniref:Monooxygenase n=1 Tax=Shewanella saliphila TaxID=2282698 RepID=A0ABQ2QAC7_9GAMM|nr:NAD(P)/FAD-dependent oxidoreductase [Shewanella saliphila]MCL1100769.1 NAD(P)/FAD-dependent oxidoreductase [Shewanella saliphila]GGP64420.1 putative monooxygenase [Shewanella saliphila]